MDYELLSKYNYCVRDNPNYTFKIEDYDKLHISKGMHVYYNTTCLMEKIGIISHETCESLFGGPSVSTRYKRSQNEPVLIVKLFQYFRDNNIVNGYGAYILSELIENNPIPKHLNMYGIDRLLHQYMLLPTVEKFHMQYKLMPQVHLDTPITNQSQLTLL